MEDILRQPDLWPEKASKFLDMAQMATDFTLREQFAELAARYLDLTMSWCRAPSPASSRHRGQPLPNMIFTLLLRPLDGENHHPQYHSGCCEQARLDPKCHGQWG